MATTMAATRQPFAPLNGSRLQNLTSLKNRQNALPTTLTSPTKRKVQTFEDDNSENIDPIIFLSPKRSKNPDAPRVNTSISKSTPLSAPAGRSPTRKRIGILNRRRTTAPFTRVEPPKFATTPAGSGGLGFSIDAALSGTIPSYKSRQSKAVPETLHEPEVKDSWFFDIHEDTAEELATNLMEHSTCTLDISSDEESAARLKDERGKENVPPLDDISQTRSQLTSVDAVEESMNDIKARIRARRAVAEGAIDVDRSPLGDLAAEEFYAEGCDGESVFIIASDEAVEEEGCETEAPGMFDFTPEVDGKGKGKEVQVDVDALMRKDDFQVAPKAMLLEPIEKADDGFEVWESGSAKDETEL
ncbi:hypothetical protein LSUB1_G004568 [Lachnellula subtilissima]|uniref:Thymidylate kinase protein n=1 Tax=Lachnellula subtilissima TaxID=602034 RepID=A0A8H8RVE8_9HELO|nr:hypothetical protein LSUB1_G004568 [Lachnellula subtilissima]